MFWALKSICVSCIFFFVLLYPLKRSKPHVVHRPFLNRLQPGFGLGAMICDSWSRVVLPSKTSCDDRNVLYLCCPYSSHRPHVVTEQLKQGQCDGRVEFYILFNSTQFNFQIFSHIGPVATILDSAGLKCCEKKFTSTLDLVFFRSMDSLHQGSRSES